MPLYCKTPWTPSLRELRLKMKQKGEAREPVDGELIRPGWVREPDGCESFSFGFRYSDFGFVKMGHRRGDRPAMATRDRHGVGMNVIKNYFTQIGKSEYRSPEFAQID